MGVDLILPTNGGRLNKGSVRRFEF